MAASFPPEAAAQAAAVDAWRVELSRSPSDVLIEETGSVGPAQASITVQIAVTLEAPCETLAIRLELSSAGQVWFRSVQNHEICTGSGNTLPAQQLEFVRPQPEWTPSTLELTLQEGRSAETSFRIAYPGTDALIWNAAVTGAPAWLSLPVTGGSVTAGRTQDVPVLIDAEGISPGTYTTRIALAAEGFSGTIGFVDVRLVVTKGPDIGLVPTSLSFTALSGADPPQQTFSVTNTGGGTLEWSATDDAAWLDLDPTAGTLGEGQSQVVTASVNSAALSAGQFPALVTVTAPQAENGPRTMAVSLVVVQPGFTITESSGATVVDETGTTDDFTVVLDAQPMSDVVFDVSGDDPGEATVAPTMLTFTPASWNVAQAVTVTGVDDPSVDGDQVSTVTISVNGPSSDPAFASLSDQTLSVTTTDDDVLGGGGMIAFASDRSGDWEVYAMNPDGSGTVNLTNSQSSDEQMPTWSPDRSQLAFTSNRDGNVEVYRMNADGSNQVNLTNNAATDQSPKWGSGGLLFETDRTGNWEIFTMGTDGSNPLNRSQAPASNERKATWSPDGARIAFDTDRAGNSDIWVMNADGSNPVSLTTDPAFDSEPAWSPDGARIAFRSLRAGPFEIVVMNADGSGQVTITSSAGQEWNPTWSSDSQQIVFSSDQDTGPGSSEIYVMDANGANLIRLTLNASFDWWPAWWN
jgi:TolB protein